MAHGKGCGNKMGKLAKEYCGVDLPLEVLKSNAGFYIGTCDPENAFPVSRESDEYFLTSEGATLALKSGNWTQRENP